MQHIDDIARAGAFEDRNLRGLSSRISDAQHHLRTGRTRIRGPRDFSTICFGAFEFRADEEGDGMMTRAEAIDLFQSDDLVGIGMAADAVRRKLHPRRRRQLHHRPQHQLHEFLHRILQLLRVLPADGPRRGLPAFEGSDLRQDSGDHRPGRHRHPDAGRAASGFEDRVVRGPAAVDQGALRRQDLEPLFFGAGDREHRRGERADAARHDCAAARCGAGVDSRRRARKFWTTTCGAGSAG